MPFRNYRTKPKAPTKRGYAESTNDRHRKFLKNRKIIFEQLFEDEPYLLRKYLQ